MIAILFASALILSAGADSGSTLMDADTEYRAGVDSRADAAKARLHFVRAAEIYEAAWAAGVRSLAIARNMAQSRYLAGELGHCIRDYRRGRQVYPHDPDLRAGLAFAREQVAYPHVGDLSDAAHPRDSETVLERLPISFSWLALIVVIAAALGWLTIARAWIASRSGLAILGGGIIVVAAISGGWLAWQNDRMHSRWAEPTAVVVAPGADLRTGNSDEYPKRLDGRLPAGVELKVLGERGGWLHVELAGGSVGWVPKERVVAVDWVGVI